jgi:putative DNA primase/helicase
MDSEEHTLLFEALAYASKGWKVFPLYEPIPDGTCSCLKSKCKHAGKHPRTSNGFKDATTDAVTIQKWWSSWPNANIGIATGSLSEIVVVDVDGDKGGFNTWKELKNTLGDIKTLTSFTGNGFHLFFIYPGDMGLKSKSNALGNGVDIKADGGYVVVPPSLHENGVRYIWEADKK